MRIFFCVLVFYLLPIRIILAQDQEIRWKKLLSIPTQKLDLLSVDNNGQILYSDFEGNITQLNSRGDSINGYSPQRQAKLAKLEAFWTVNHFLYSSDLQEYVLLDRFLNVLTSSSISSENIGLAKVATLGNNNVLWVFDESDLSINQIDYNSHQIKQKQTLPLIIGQRELVVLDMMERDNMLFVNMEGLGIFVFDNQANLIKKINSFTGQPLSYHKNNFFFIENRQMVRVDIRTNREEYFNLPEINPSGLLVQKDKFYFYNQRQIDIYQFPEFK